MQKSELTGIIALIPTLATQGQYPVLSHLESLQFSSAIQSCLTLCDPMDCSTAALSVHHQLPEFTQTHVHWLSDTIQPSHPLSSLSPPTFNLSQHQGFFKWVSFCIRWAKYWSFSFKMPYCRWLLWLRACLHPKFPHSSPLGWRLDDCSILCW